MLSANNETCEDLIVRWKPKETESLQYHQLEQQVLWVNVLKAVCGVKQHLPEAGQVAFSPLQ